LSLRAKPAARAGSLDFARFDPLFAKPPSIERIDVLGLENQPPAS